MACEMLLESQGPGARGVAPQLLPSKLPGAQQAPTLPLSEAGTSKPPSRIILSFLSITAACVSPAWACQAGELCGAPSPCPPPFCWLVPWYLPEPKRSSDLRLPAPLGCS